MNTVKLAATTTVILLVAAVALVAAYYEGYFTPKPNNGMTVHFTIIEETSGPFYGMNGSGLPSHSGQNWPVLNVLKGDTVVINVTNEGSSEPHGFAIAHYFDSGVTVRPGQSYIVTFVANQVGSFKIYCSIFCTIHAYMQNGILNVTSS